jgi:hypothetical protein
VAPHALDNFWSPLLDAPGITLAVIGSLIPTPPRGALPADFSITQHIFDGDHITVSDANALFRMAELFGNHGKIARVQTAPSPPGNS